MTSGASSARDGDARDASSARDVLVRGALGNVAVQLGRLANPILFVVVARAYGPENLGAFATAQAIVFVLGRLSLFGLDRAIAALVPRAELGSRSVGLVDALVRSGRVGLAFSFAFLACAAWTRATPFSVYALAAISVVPVITLDLLAQTLAGFRRLTPALVVRELVVPIGASLASLLFRALDRGAAGLALGQLVGTMLGLAIATREVRHAFVAAGIDPRGRLSFEQRRRAIALGFADTATTAMVRLDVPLVALFLGRTEAGVFAAVAQIVNTVRSIATNFEGLTTAVVSRAKASAGASSGDARARLAAVESALSSAMALVALVELPLVAFFVLFGEQALAIFGPGFERGASAAAIASIGVAIQGTLGLAGPAAVGLGRVGLFGIAAAIALAAEGILFALLLPRYGLVGAGVSVAIASVLHGAFVFSALHRLLGGLAFDRSAKRSLVTLGLGLVVAALMASLPLGTSASRGLAFAVTVVASFVAAWEQSGRSISSRDRKAVVSRETSELPSHHDRTTDATCPSTQPEG